MSHIFDFHESRAYARWLEQDDARAVSAFAHRLIIDMLKPSKGESVLDIGCGTGNSLKPFLDCGIDGTGIDASPYMLDLAMQTLGTGVDLHRGMAEDLPFEDSSFNYACLNITLAFVDQPEQVIREACRVAKDKIFIGVFNRYAIKGIQRRIRGIFSPTIFTRARFYSVWEIKHMLRQILGDVPLFWRTVCHLPMSSGRIAASIERNSLIQRSPTGEFAGIVATLVPRFRTRPLAIKYTDMKQSAGMVPG